MIFKEVRLISEATCKTIQKALEYKLNQVVTERKVLEQLSAYPDARNNLPKLLREEADIRDAIRELEGVIT